MCYVVEINFIGQWHLLLDFNWSFNGPIMWPVWLQAPGNRTGQIGQFWSYNSKISYKYGLLRTNQIHIKHFLIDTIKEGNRLVDVSVERELIVSTAQTLCSMDGKNCPQNSRATGWTIEQHHLVCTRYAPCFSKILRPPYRTHWSLVRISENGVGKATCTKIIVALPFE